MKKDGLDSFIKGITNGNAISSLKNTKWLDKGWTKMDMRKDPAAVLGRKYQDAIRSYSRLLSDPTLKLDFLQEADAYFRRCALGMWSKGGAVTQAHVDAYNSICSPGHVPSQALFFEVAAGAAEPRPFRKPAFFDELVDFDRTTEQNRTAQFIELCSVVMLLFASIDDKVTQEEADYITDCLELLRSEAARDGVLSHTNTAGNGSTKQPDTDEPKREQPAQGGEVATQEKQTQTATEEEKPLPTVEELLAQLDELCGLEKVKKDVRSLINLIKIRKLRKENNLPVPPMSLHLVFMGNPGTGKTTVARLLAGLYRAIGVLPKGQLVEVDRSGLVAGFVGQTAIQTQKVIQSAMGGVLFIDEAYALAGEGNDFGREAIDTILKAMEDHRDELVVVVAGYQQPMSRFLSSNPGLESRFNKYFYFEDYTGEQLEQIFMIQCKKNGYAPDDELKSVLPDFFKEMYNDRDDNFGNGRDVRNLFEQLISAQSDRVAQLEEVTVEDLMNITKADFDAVTKDEEEAPAPEANKAVEAVVDAIQEIVEAGAAEQTE